MYFEANFGIFDDDFDRNKFRQTVKGIVIRDGKILMIKSSRGDYTFPGGRLEKNESHKEGLIRELKEETGYDCLAVKDFLGTTLLRKVDKYDSDKLYELIAYYYLCELSHDQGEQSLCENEMKRGLEPIWVSLPDVVSNNARFLFNERRVEYWLEQVNYVIPRIYEYVKKLDN